MAKIGRPKKIRGNVVKMETIPDPNAPPEENQPEMPKTETTAEQTPNPTPEPPKSYRKPNFWQRVAAVAKPDWGTRVFIYVYCLEPICNLKMGGESKYLVRLSEPINDEQALMVDYGSGKYRLQMVNRKPGLEKGDCMDTVEIEIYNPKFPPKIPRSVWINDPRNERWAALLPKEEPAAQQTGLGTVTDAFKTFTEIRRDLREELKPPEQPAVASPESAMNNTLQMVQTIMAMKADNPMVEIMKAQLQAANDNAQKAMDREATLQKELRDQLRAIAEKANKPNDKPEKSGLSLIQETAEAIEKLSPTLQKLLPQVGGALDNVRGHRTNWIDIVREVAPSIIDYAGRISVAIAARGPVPPAAPNGSYSNGQPMVTPAAPQINPPNGQPAQTTEQRIMAFLQQPVISSALMAYFRNPATSGADFAQWVFDGVGEAPLKDARGLGTERIMGLFKTSPGWPAMATQEAKLTEFVDQCLAWQPGTEPEDDDEEEDDSGIDLTAATM